MTTDKPNKNKIVMSALADLWTRDILELVESGKHKQAINIGVKMGLSKKYVKNVVKWWKLQKQNNVR